LIVHSMDFADNYFVMKLSRVNGVFTILEIISKVLKLKVLKFFSVYLLLSLIFHVFAVKDIPIKKIGKKKYILYEDFIKVHPRVKGRLDHLQLIVELYFNKKKVRLKIDHPYYISGGNQYPLNYPPVIYRKKVYLPAQIAEDLLSELRVPVKYKYENKKIHVEKIKTTKRSNKLQFILIDPGHGGRDPGAIGLHQKEKEITLRVAQDVFLYLKKAFPNTKVMITRYKDKYISLEKRVKITNLKYRQKGFGIFISLHCNTTLQKKVHGYEIYHLSQNPDSEQARLVMLKENVTQKKNPHVTSLETILMDSQLMAESKVLARQLNRAFMTHLNQMVSSRGVKRADFAVLRGAMVPAILVEMGYITNKAELQVLKSKKYRQKLSAAIADGIRRFIKYKPEI